MALWGALDEAHQEWIPGRRTDSADLAADIAGATVGALLGGDSFRRRSRSDRRGGPATS
jgi:VanZ family protein